VNEAFRALHTSEDESLARYAGIINYISRSKLSARIGNSKSISVWLSEVADDYRRQCAHLIDDREVSV